jgi:hypothetical protein
VKIIKDFAPEIRTSKKMQIELILKDQPGLSAKTDLVLLQSYLHSQEEPALCIVIIDKDQRFVLRECYYLDGVHITDEEQISRIVHNQQIKTSFAKVLE